MAMPFKDRYKRNKDILEWYDALAVAVAVIALVFTFGLRVVQVDGHSMQPTLLNGERLLMTPLGRPRITATSSSWTATSRTASRWSSA